jgi:DNA invertase Pin-like site-specific DNA recombinase
MIARYVEMKAQFKTWEVEGLEYYVEPGRSAKDLNRPELQRLMRDVEAGRTDIIVCYKFDRLSRKLRDFLELYETLHSYGVRVVSLSEDIDTTGHGGEAMLQIMLVLAEWERKQTRERTIDGMTQRAARGLWNGGYLIGYRRVEGGKGRLEPDPEWAPKVKTFFFDKFEELGSVSAVQAWLERNGVVQPVWKSRTERVHGGQPFSEQQVKRVLTTRRYLGENRWGDGCVVPGSFEPIIGVEQFDRVQRKLAENARTRANHRRSRGHDYPLKGLVRCRLCKSMMTPSSVKKPGAIRETRYYRCTRQGHFAGATACPAKLVPAAALERAVVDRLRQISLS